METKRKPVAPFYAVAVLWLACGLLVPLYEPLHYALVAVVSVAVFGIASALCRSGATGQTEQKRSPKSRRTPPPATRSWTRCSRMGAWPSRR